MGRQLVSLGEWYVHGSVVRWLGELQTVSYHTHRQAQSRRLEESEFDYLVFETVNREGTESPERVV